MTLRSLLVRAAFAGSLLPVGLVGGMAHAEGLRLKAEAVVEGAAVRLGDLIDGLETGSDIPVFQSPAPGARGVIRADRIIAAAREMGIDGVISGGVSAVTINRSGRTVTRMELQQIIVRAFAERGFKGDLDVAIDEHHAARIVDASKADSLKVASLVRDPVSGRFEARLASQAGPDGGMLTGTMIETREVAVPVTDLDRGDALQAKDLAVVRRPANQIAPNVITSAAELVGMVPRRALKAGEPIRQADLARAILVEKNQLITVTYASAGLALAMRGRAQANAALGETVRVLNPQSKRMIEGTVTGLAQVTITSPPTPPASVADALAAGRQ